MDDAFFVQTSKSALRECIPLINDFLKVNLGLEIHPCKVVIRAQSQKGVDNPVCFKFGI